MTLAILAFIAGSIGCWYLVARTPRTHRVVLPVLACLAIAELLLLGGWIFAGERYSLLVTLAVATMITLLSGITAEEHAPGARPFRHAPLRVRFGTLVTGAYCTVTAAAIVFFGCGVWAFGEPAATPSGNGVATPPGLSLVSSRDQGCGGQQAGAQLTCARRITFAAPAAAGGGGSKAGVLTAQQAAQALAASMRAGDGWPMAAGPAGTWHGCHQVGWFLDAHAECASVTAAQDQAVLTLTAAGDW